MIKTILCENDKSDLEIKELLRQKDMKGVKEAI